MDGPEIAARREAARRRLAGESPRVIARDLGRTRQWVAKWAARYDPHDPVVGGGPSRAPKRVAPGARRPGSWRRCLRYASAWRRTRGRRSVRRRSRGSLRSSARWRRLSGRSSGSSRARVRPSVSVQAGASRQGIPYPAPAARRAGDVAQVDLVGPRHLDGGVRFHALNQIDVASHHAGIEIVEDRGDQRVLVRAARDVVPPRRAAAGSSSTTAARSCSPTGLGEVVRVCLHQGATPVFIPPREPWRNGTIERFNDTFDQRFFRHGALHRSSRT